MPTMLAAASYDLYKNASLFSNADVQVIAVGFITAFLSALFVVRAVLAFISKHTYRAFGWYRIVLGIIVGVWLYRLG
jgi:undecaprenyl-diphosphatase